MYSMPYGNSWWVRKDDYDQLCEIVRALCEDVEGKLPAGVADYDTHRYCIYCDAIDVYQLSDHAHDCAIVLGRQALAGRGK